MEVNRSFMMKKLLFLLVLLGFSHTYAVCKKDPAGWYFGSDFQIRRVCYTECSKNQKTISYSPRANGYLGYRVNEYFGFEFGYAQSTSKSKGSIFSADESSTDDGVVSDILQNTSTKTEEATKQSTPQSTPTSLVKSNDIILQNKVKLSGPHFDLVLFYPLPDFRATELIGSIGAMHLRSEFRRDITESGSQVGIRDVARTPVIRLTGGVQTMITDNIRFRFVVGWLNTSRYVISHGYKKCGVSLLPSLTAKDTLFYGVGLNWKF